LFPQTTTWSGTRTKPGEGYIFNGHGDKPAGHRGRDGDSGSASRFFYCAKASRAEREAGLDNIEIIMVEYRTWENEDRKVRLRVDMGQSPPKVIAAYGTPNNGATAWSMFLFGNSTTAPSLAATPCTISTGKNSITESKTLSYLAHSLTNDFIAGASGESGSGGSPAVNAAGRSPYLIITRERTESLRGVGPVASATRLRISGNVGSPADHPTVKPLALMRYLVKLVTRPGHVVLDPFMGSGTTGIACRELGREFIGIEKEAEYCEIARRRINA
jgi:hypothetical protein